MMILQALHVTRGWTNRGIVRDDAEAHRKIMELRKHGFIEFNINKDRFRSNRRRAIKMKQAFFYTH